MTEDVEVHRYKYADGKVAEYFPVEIDLSDEAALELLAVLKKLPKTKKQVHIRELVKELKKAYK